MIEISAFLDDIDRPRLFNHISGIRNPGLSIYLNNGDKIPMPMATKFAQRKKIKKLAKHKRNQKNNLAKNFLLPNFNLIANNNLNI
jgi:hypothetical protein